MSGLTDSKGALRRRVAPLAVLLAAVLTGPSAASAGGPQAATTSFTGWSSEALDLAASLPVQEGGRVKPLSTYALYTLMAFSGRRALKVEGAPSLSPTEWLLDVLLVPDVAARQRVFRVEDDASLDAIGLPHEGRAKRDWYSYAELSPAFGRLQELGARYAGLPAAERSWVAEQVAALFQNVLHYSQLQGSLYFALEPVPVAKLPGLTRFFGQAPAVPWSAVLERLPELVKALPPDPPQGREPEPPSEEVRSVAALLAGVERLATEEGALALFPPPRSSGADEAWRTSHGVLVEVTRTGRVEPDVVALVKAWEAVGASVADSPAADRALREVHALTTARARERGEYDRVPLEVAYYRVAPISWSLWTFLLASLVGLLVLFASGRWERALRLLSWASVGGALALLVGAIVVRCLIRSRPPVTTLYEATLFITATASLLALVVEIIGRRRWPLLVAASFGLVGLYVAGRYEELTATDTMPTLVAVLDTNFWLSTHVTCVTLGYTAGLLAAFIGAIHVVGRALGLGKDQHAFYAGVSRATYGVLCFGLLFSVVGTILGGIWANESWGRFWGWDPKENGALMIVLADLAIVHARLGGYVRQHGLCMAAVFGGGVVVFSYWGVNLLGVGLHSYGFTAGLGRGIAIYYVIEAAILAAGTVWWLMERSRRAAA